MRRRGSTNVQLDPIKMIKRLLSVDAELVYLEEQEAPVILEVDFNQDAVQEWVTLYKKQNKYYLLGVQKQRGGGSVIWDKQLQYTQIYYFQLAQFESSTKYEIVIAGEIEGRERNQLMILECVGNRVVTFFRDYIAFDKMAVLDVDGEDGRDELLLWNYTLLDQAIGIYRYQRGKLIDAPELRPYLMKNTKFSKPDQEYPKSQAMEVQSQEDQQTQLKEEVEPFGALEEVQEELQETYEEEIDRGDELTFLHGLMGTLEKGLKGDAFLFGKMEQHQQTLEQVGVMMTVQGDSKKHWLDLQVKHIESYDMVMGRFLNRKDEQVFIRLVQCEPERIVHAFLMGLEKGEIVQYLWNQHFDSGEDMVFDNIYAVDLGLHQKYTLFMKYRYTSLSGDSTYLIKTFKGTENKLVPEKWIEIKEKEMSV